MAKKKKVVKVPTMEEFLKPLAVLPLSTRKAIWQYIDDLEVTSGGGEGDGRMAVAKFVKHALTIIGK